MKKLLLALLLLFPSIADAQQCLLQGKCIMTDNAGGSPSAILPAQVVANLFAVPFPGKVTVPASVAAQAGLNIPNGVAPTTPYAGDIWTTSAASGLFWYTDSTTYQAAALASPAFTGVPTAPTNSSPYDASTQIATDAFVQNALNYSMSTSPMALVTGTYSFATTSTNFPVISIAQSGGVVSSATVLAGGSGLAVGDLIVASGGNGDCILRVATLSGSSAATLTVVYGGTGYATQSGITTNGANIIPYTFVLTGALSGNVTIIMPNGTYLANSQQWFFANNTTNAHTVTVCLSGGADSCNSGRTAVIPQGSNNSRVVGVITDGTTNVDIASIINAADLTGTTLASGVTGSSLTSTGTLTSLTVSGLLSTNLSGTGGAGFNLPNGAAPTSPNAGDVWTTSAACGLFFYTNSATYSPACLSGATFTGEVVTHLSGTGGAGFNLPNGAAPSSPAAGDIWTTSGASGLFWYTNSTTYQAAALASPVFTGTVTAPTIAGGSAASTAMVIESTTGSGTSDTLTFKTGSQVAAAVVDTAQHWRLGNTNATTITSGNCGTGTNGSLASGSNDHAGQIQIGSAATASCIINFSANYATAPRACILFPANSTAANIGTEKPYVSAIAVGSFTVSGSVLASNNFYYFCE